jgi:hypothetical protein
MRRLFNLKPLIVGVVATLMSVGILLLASHPTTAARVGGRQAQPVAQNALPHAPAAAGLRGPQPMLW